MSRKRKIAAIPGWRRVIVLTFALCAMMGLAVNGMAQDADEATATQGPILIDIEVRNDSKYLTEAMIREMLDDSLIGAPFDYEKMLAEIRAINDWVLETYGAQIVTLIGAFREHPEGKVNPAKDGIQVVFRTEEEISHPVLSAIRIDTDVKSEEWFLSQVDFRPGMLFSDENLAKLMDQLASVIERVAEEDGIGFESTVHYVEAAPGSSEIELWITLRAVRINNVIVLGHEKTRDFVIDRELRTKGGAPINEELYDSIRGDVMRLMRLGHFEEVLPEFVETEEMGKYDLIYRIRERQTGMAGFGAGYSSASGLMGYIEVADTNLFGRGQQAHLRWEFGAKQSLYDLGFTEPRLFGTRASVGFNLYNQIQNDLKGRDEHGNDYTFSQRNFGGTFTAGYRFTDNLRGSLAYRAETIYHTPDDTKVTQSAPVRTLIASLNYDTSNSVHYPTEGLRAGLSVENGGKFLGGDLHFVKMQGSLSSYHRVGQNDQVVAWRVMAGSGLEALPSSEIFRLGGSESVRAYGYGAMQGDRMLLSNVEYRFPVSDSVHGVAFIDAGQAWDIDDPVNLKDLRFAYGVGLRVDTPIGPLRVDLGTGDEGARVFFGIGPAF